MEKTKRSSNPPQRAAIGLILLFVFGLFMQCAKESDNSSGDALGLLLLGGAGGEEGARWGDARWGQSYWNE